MRHASAPLVVGYVRVSTEEQAREGVSLDAQEGRIRAWWELYGEGRELVICRDEGVSGSVDNRPGLLAALAACRRGGVLVAYSISRLSRSTQHMLTLSEKLEKAGCDLVSLSEKIDTTSAAGRMVFQMLAVLAEFERRQTGERTASALASLRARGLRYSRFAEVPAEVCRRAAELRGAGMSLRAVGEALLLEGLAPVAGGRQWSPKVVRDMVARVRA